MSVTMCVVFQRERIESFQYGRVPGQDSPEDLGADQQHHGGKICFEFFALPGAQGSGSGLNLYESRLPRRAFKRKKIPHLRFQLFSAQKYLFFSDPLKFKSKPRTVEKYLKILIVE